MCDSVSIYNANHAETTALLSGRVWMCICKGLFDSDRIFDIGAYKFPPAEMQH